MAFLRFFWRSRGVTRERRRRSASGAVGRPTRPLRMPGDRVRAPACSARHDLPRFPRGGAERALRGAAWPWGRTFGHPAVLVGAWVGFCGAERARRARRRPRPRLSTHFRRAASTRWGGQPLRRQLRAFMLSRRPWVAWQRTWSIQAAFPPTSSPQQGRPDFPPAGSG